MVLGKQFGDDQFTWLMQWAYCGIWQAKEDTVKLNPVEARSLEGLSALGRLGLEGLLLFIFFNGSFDHLESGGEVFHRVLQFLLR